MLTLVPLTIPTEVAAGGQPKKGSFVARAVPFSVAQPDVPGPRKASCLGGIEGVHKVTHSFRAPARGVVDVRMDDLSGDWDLYVLTETGESLGASETSQVLEGAHGQERVTVHLEPDEPVDMVACNWLGEPEVTVHFTFQRGFTPPEGLVVYATCPGVDGTWDVSCFEPEAGSIPTKAEVFTMSATASTPRRVTHNDLRELFPVWSPDGKRAAGFASTRRKRVGPCGLYTLGLRTGETKRLVGPRNPADHSCPLPNDWSPDGKWILFTTASEEIGAVYKIRPDGRGLTSLTQHDWEMWGHDPYFVGRDIVYLESGTARNGIVRMDARGRNRKWLKRGCVSTLAASPDDRWIAYVCRQSLEGPYDLYLMRPDGSAQVRVDRSADWIAELVFSPDETKVAFASWSKKADRVRVYDLVRDEVLDIPLPEGADYPHEVTWSPSGTYVAYSVALANEWGHAAYFARVGGERAYRLTKASDEHSLFAWLPGA